MGYNDRRENDGRSVAVAGGESPLGYNRPSRDAMNTTAVAGGESPLGYNPSPVGVPSMRL